MSATVEVGIVGAGPYGLSIAAHLQGCGISSRIFGPPMEVWRQHMPKGMLLKSDGFASNLSDPARSLTLKHFCAAQGRPYQDTNLPVPIETFIEYALAFQQKFVPHLDVRQVAHIERTPDGYQLQLADGETVRARRVVLAVGITHFAYVPPSLAALPADLLSHSSAHNDCSIFRGKRVTVIGAGASAIDLAALMHESGADVSLVAKASIIRFHDRPRPGARTLWQQMRNPSSGLGPGWKSRFYTDLPLAFHRFPERHRLRIVQQHLGPAPGWPMKQRVEGKFPILLGRTIAKAQVLNGGVRLSLSSGDRQMEEHETGHVVAATGYRPDLRRLHFLDESIRNELRAVEYTPVLSTNFESSLPGLYFVGIAAANNFGPMMRFAYGSDYTARRLTTHLQKQVQG